MLSLVEEILLLGLDDESGEFLPVPEYSLELSLAGAVLMDLALRDRLDSDMQRMMVVNSAPTGDDILDPVLVELSGSEAELVPRQWLMRLARRQSLRQEALDRLVERGVLRRDDKRILWVFGSRRYPVIDNREEREVKLRILQILLGEEIPAPADVALICLASTCSLFPAILSAREHHNVAEKIEQITRMDLIGQKMLSELRDLHQSVSRTGWWGVSGSSEG